MSVRPFNLFICQYRYTFFVKFFPCIRSVSNLLLDQSLFQNTKTKIKFSLCTNDILTFFFQFITFSFHFSNLIVGKQGKGSPLLIIVRPYTKSPQKRNIGVSVLHKYLLPLYGMNNLILKTREVNCVTPTERFK